MNKDYKKLLELATDIMEHIEFRTYLYGNINIKNTDEYQELRKYIRDVLGH